jgi:feruloyl esterase
MAAALSAWLVMATAHGAVECAALASGARADVDFIRAKAVPAESGAAAYCLVEGSLEGAISFELRLPATWNGKLLFQGYGGLDGAPPSFTQTLQLGSPGGVGAFERGYAIVTTDTGHRLPGDRTDVASYGDWAITDGAARKNWAHRSTHVVAEHAKQIITRYYGAPARYAYYQGCSGGGRQAAMAAQRYPHDFNGVIAGAPWLKPSGQSIAMNRQLEGAADLAPKLQWISATMLQACDGADGLADGLISDPSQCREAPAALLCKHGDAPDCLTERQAQTLQALYGGVADSHGTVRFPGYARGGELGWRPAIVPPENGRSANDLLQRAFLRGFVFGEAYEGGRIHERIEKIVPAHVARLVDVRPDLRAFRAAGGKLLMWHGWDDARLSPEYSIWFYAQVQRAMAREPGTARDFFRLFMVPGMAHCNGGRGPNRFDTLTALEQWVEMGIAPDRIVATGSEPGGLVRTRPLCPYPQRAAYSGRGSSEEAERFDCK